MKSREATELLLGTARAGKFDVTQLGQSIGQVIPVAAAMGVHFDEVGAFIAGFTRINGDAAQSVTYLRGFLSTLLAPTDEVKSVLKDLSKATGDTTLSVGGLQKELREKGLVETLQHLIHATGGNVTILGKIIPSVEGLTGVLGTAGLQGERFTGVLGEVRGALGTLDQTFATSHATDGAQFKEATANLQVLALVELVHAGEPVIKWATGAAEWFGELPEPVKDTGLAVVGVVASFGPLLYVGGSVLQLYKSLQVAHVILTADLFKKAGAAGAAAAADGAEATAAGAAAEATDLEAAAAKDAAAAMSQLTLTADEAAGANAEAGVTAGEAATAIEGEAAAARDAATALATVATEADAAATGAEAAATALSSTATGADAAAAGTAAVGAAAASTAAVVGTTLVAALGAAALGYWMVKDRSHEAADEVEESARRAANAATLFNGSVATMSQSAAYAALGEKGHALAATEAQLAHLQQQQKEMAAGAPGFFGRSAAAAVAMWGANPEYVQRLWDRDDRARVIEEQVTRLTQARDALQSEVGALTERVHTTSAPPDPLANNPALQALIAQLNQPNGGRTRERKQTPDQRGLAVELAPTLQNVAALGDAFTDLDAQVLKAQTDLYASLGALQTLPVRSDAFKAKNEEVFNLSVKLRGLRAELEATRLAFNFRSAQMGGATLAADGTLVPNANARAISTTVSTAAQRTLTMEQLGGRWQSWGVTREMEQQNRRTELAGAARIGAGWGDLSDAQRAAAGSKREYQDMVASYHQGSLQLKQASVVAVDAFSQMAQAVISGSQTTSEAMVSMVTQIAQAAVPASAGPLVGPIIGAVGGILGALIAKRHKDAQEAQQKVQPVSVERYSPEALRQQSTKEGPDAVFLQMVDANTGRTISEQKYLLDRGERRDAVNRIPSASRSSF
jgi:hypothetical protein